MSRKIEKLLKQAASQAENTPQESSVTGSSRTFATAAEAEKAFADYKQKLLRVKEWNAESGISSFELFEENGKLSHRKQAVIGDFIRITLHGSGKSDWVRIFDLSDAPDEMVLTLKPFYDPTEKEPDKTIVSHFFAGAATNNFCLERKEETVNFCVIGLNEKTNTSETEGFIETVRNFATANVGFYFGIQKSEWKTFSENFLETK